MHFLNASIAYMLNAFTVSRQLKPALCNNTVQTTHVSSRSFTRWTFSKTNSVEIVRVRVSAALQSTSESWATTRYL